MQIIERGETTPEEDISWYIYTFISIGMEITLPLFNQSD